MKKLNLIKPSFIYILACIFSFSLFAASTTNSAKSDLNVTKIVVSDELRAKYKIKPHHEHLAFDCIDCHSRQGDDPSKFKAIGDNGCMQCHKSKKLIAQRLNFMDTLKANPHNSVHDGPTLYCDECHFEHKESTNMCIECHEHEVPQWMGVTP
ncbi:cytochrome c3 family protein [Campylobacter sp. faydin G-105]|uniref:cytochrome c3 family protein n=1 Tax=Campylobacter anatolicus TaxID=2829105 RepID=UPI001B99DCBF|nr:cytochrome c3 family protein [Campylobacter anatolicus]MBR8461432.1 cytochrome c3 family protein [Campylobacter anatolicus]